MGDDLLGIQLCFDICTLLYIIYIRVGTCGIIVQLLRIAVFKLHTNQGTRIKRQKS